MNSKIVFSGTLIGDGSICTISSANFLTTDDEVVEVRKGDSYYNFLSDGTAMGTWNNVYYINSSNEKCDTRELKKFLGFIYGKDNELEFTVDDVEVNFDKHLDCAVIINDNDKKMFENWGYDVVKDIPQIQEAIDKATYQINYRQEITAQTACELLERKHFMSMMGRAAFHRSASRTIDAGLGCVVNATVIFE